MTRYLLLAACCLLFGAAIAQKKYDATWASLDVRPIPAWFEDAKFGIFIHWGVYAVPAYSPTVRDSVHIYDRYAEHYWRRLVQPNSTQQYFIDFQRKMYGDKATYQDFVKDFKAELFEPNDWAERFKKAGAKYVVLTSKHHEGFPLWQSPQAWNWNAVDVGPKRDLLGDLTNAVRAEGLKMGYYYSLLEWFHPLYKKETINQYVNEHMMPQMKDLVTRYKPDIFWPDGEWDYPSSVLKSTEFLAWLYNESPVKETVITNDRWGQETRGKHGGYYTTEYDLIHNGIFMDQGYTHPWEECRGIAGSFGYNRMEILEDYSSSEELVHILINKVARGGNLLLNIGPTADGRIPVIMQQRLSDMGKWLEINGEGIYGTRRWEKAPKIAPETTMYYTKKGKDLYVICTRFPEQNIIIDQVNNPSKVSILGLKTPIKSSFKNGKLTIAPPTVTPANNPCNYAWVFKLENAL